MLDFLKGWVLNIVTLVMFIVLLEILIPSGKIKKFVNLISGFVLIIAIISPMLGLFNKGIDLKEFHMSSSNFIDRKEIEAKSRILKEQQMKQITEVYRKKLIRQLEETTKEIKGVADVQADVLIDEDYKSSSFGEIKRVYLNLKLGDKGTGIKPVARIEKVEIGNGGKADSGNKEIDVELKKTIENKINKSFGVQSENIVISLQKG